MKRFNALQRSASGGRSVQRSHDGFAAAAAPEERDQRLAAGSGAGGRERINQRHCPATCRLEGLLAALAEVQEE